MLANGPLRPCCGSQVAVEQRTHRLSHALVSRSRTRYFRFLGEADISARDSCRSRRRSALLRVKPLFVTSALHPKAASSP